MLVLTLYLMRKRIRIGRVILAAILGAVASTIMLISGLHYGIMYLLVLFGVGIMMLAIAMEKKDKHEMMVGLVYYFMLVFVFSKLLKGGEWVVKSKVNGMTIALAVVVIMSVTMGYIIYQNHKNRKNTIYQVSIIEQGKQIDVKALFDTGNALTDPFSGKPVSILEKAVWSEVMKEQRAECFKIIPFHSIGQEHGILQGTEIEELIIWAGDRKIVQKQAIIALYEGSLSKDKDYQMILHQELLSLGG